MTIRAMLLPLFVEVALTFVLVFWTARARTAALRSGAAKMKDTALGQPNWPPRATQIANSYNSQFQLPVLFYVLTVLAIVTRHADLLFVVMAWLFVVDAARPRLYPHRQQLRAESFLRVCRRRHRAAADVDRLRRAHPRRACHDAGRAAGRGDRSLRGDREGAPAGRRRAQVAGAWRTASPAPATARPSPAWSMTRCAGARRAPGSWAPTPRAPFSSACSSASAGSTPKRSTSSPTARALRPRRSATKSATSST